MSNRRYSVTIDKTTRFWRLFYGILLFLNGIALGGLIVTIGIRHIVMQHCCINGRWNPDDWWAIANDMVPHYVVFGIASPFLAFVLMIVWFVGRRRSGTQS